MKHANLKALFTAIANSIRNKTGGTDAIIADDFPEAIDGIQTGGGVDKIQRYIELNGNKADYLFYHFSGTSVDEFMEGVDTRNVKSMKNMFSNCKALQSIPSIDARSAGTLTAMFSYCEKLTECWLRNIIGSLQVGNGTDFGHLLTLESLLHLCKECRKTTSSLKLTVGTANLEKLANVYVKLIDITDDMRAEDDLIDEKNPFVQCESTDDGAMTIQDYMALKMWTLA